MYEEREEEQVCSEGSCGVALVAEEKMRHHGESTFLNI